MALLCVLSRLRSNLFLIIGQIGVGISLILGVLMCNWTEDAERFLILSIYYAVTQTIFFVSHLRREYYRNAVNLVSWSIGLLILVFGAAASYTEGSAAGQRYCFLCLRRFRYCLAASWQKWMRMENCLAVSWGHCVSSFSADCF